MPNLDCFRQSTRHSYYILGREGGAEELAVGGREGEREGGRGVKEWSKGGRGVREGSGNHSYPITANSLRWLFKRK